MDVAAEFRIWGVSAGEEHDESDGQGKGSLVWAHSGSSFLTRLNFRPVSLPSVSGSGGFCCSRMAGNQDGEGVSKLVRVDWRPLRNSGTAYSWFNFRFADDAEVLACRLKSECRVSI